MLIVPRMPGVLLLLALYGPASGAEIEPVPAPAPLLGGSIGGGIGIGAPLEDELSAKLAYFPDETPDSVHDAFANVPLMNDSPYDDDKPFPRNAGFAIEGEDDGDEGYIGDGAEENESEYDEEGNARAVEVRESVEADDGNSVEVRPSRELLAKIRSNPEMERENEETMAHVQQLAVGQVINTAVCAGWKKCKKLVKRCRKHGVTDFNHHHASTPAGLSPSMCIDAEIVHAYHAFQRRKKKKRHSDYVEVMGLSALIPISTMSGEFTHERMENFFLGPLFDDMRTQVDEFDGVRAVLSRMDMRMYKNVSAEAALSHVNCNGPTHLFICRVAVMASLRLIGQASPATWVLWERLGHYFRASGHGFYALQCFRKALCVAPHRLNLMHSVASVIHRYAYIDDALTILQPVLNAYPEAIVFQITRCQLLAELCAGYGREAANLVYSTRLEWGVEALQCYDTLLERYGSNPHHASDFNAQRSKISWDLLRVRALYFTAGGAWYIGLGCSLAAAGSVMFCLQGASRSNRSRKAKAKAKAKHNKRY